MQTYNDGLSIFTVLVLTAVLLCTSQIAVCIPLYRLDTDATCNRPNGRSSFDEMKSKAVSILGLLCSVCGDRSVAE